MEAVISAKLPDNILAHSLTVRISRVVSDVEAPGGKGGNV